MANSDDIQRKIQELTQSKQVLSQAYQEPREVRDAAIAELERLEELERVQRQIRADANAKIRRIDAEARQIDSDLDYLARAYQDAINAENAARAFAEKREKLTEQLQGYAWAEVIFPHQIDGAFNIIANGCRVLLADTRGLGKTLTAIAAADMVGSKYIICVTQNDLVQNLCDEIRLRSPKRFVLNLSGLTKTDREAKLEFLRSGKAAGILQQYTVVVNYEAWRRDMSLIDQLGRCQFDTAILDEIHNAKSRKTATYRGIHKLITQENLDPHSPSYVDPWSYLDIAEDTRPNLGGFWENSSVKFVLPMTGTPILNRPEDLYAILTLIDPYHHANNHDGENRWLRNYCWFDRYTQRWKFQPGGQKALVNTLGGSFIRRDRHTPGVEFPAEPEFITHYLEFDDESYANQRRIMEQISKYAQLVLSEDEKTSFDYVLQLITRKRQAVTWPSQITIKRPDGTEFTVGETGAESIKLDRVLNNSEGTGILSELDDSDAAVVFSQFKGVLHELKRRCDEAGIKAVVMDGATPESMRAEIRKEFDARTTTGKWQVVLANYKTGGTGLNLTAANVMVLVDQEWNPGKEDQAVGRFDRIGQNRGTEVHTLIVRGSIDVWMQGLIQEKRLEQEGVYSEVSLMQEMRRQLLDGDLL